MGGLWGKGEGGESALDWEQSYVCTYVEELNAICRSGVSL